MRLQQSQEQRYPDLPVWCVHLGKATAAARAALPKPTSMVCTQVGKPLSSRKSSATQTHQYGVCTWVRLQQPQEQRYPDRPTTSTVCAFSWTEIVQGSVLVFMHYVSDLGKAKDYTRQARSKTGLGNKAL